MYFMIFKELRYRLWCIPAAVMIMLGFDLLMGIDAVFVEETIILLPILICFTVYRGKNESELLVVAPVATANVRLIRFAASFFLFCVPMALYCLFVLDNAPERFFVFVLSLAFVTSSFAFLLRTIVRNNVAAALLSVALLLLLRNTVSWAGNLRFFQIFNSMEIISERIFYVGRATTVLCGTTLIGIAWLILFFTERKRI